ncbi:MAG TPA: 2OG-Fe(II) oxygenase [Croceibacterium sp.]|nr:2OG-Fe(II) oxygenase [Croceibacterium sp.]
MAIVPAPLPHENPDKDRLRRIGRKVRERLAAHREVHKIPTEKAELWAVANFFDPVECGRLMAITDAVAQPSKAFDAAYSSGYRTSYSGDVDPHDPFIRKLQRRIDDLLGIDPTYGETIQTQRYMEGQQFQAHTDWFPANTPYWELEKDRGGQRSFTAMAFLNAVEEGGDTAFPRLGVAVSPQPGALLIWNNADENGTPNPWTVHAGTPVTKGVKYIITKWYRCRRWH